MSTSSSIPRPAPAGKAGLAPPVSARLEPARLEIADLPSPNHGPRRGVTGPDMILIHYTAMATAQAALDRLRSPEAEVSAHFLIDEDGRIFRLVPERRRAWHAGVAAWGAARDVNSRSIGIELSHPGPVSSPPPPFAEAQLAALAALVADLRARWSIPPERVLGHSDVALGRKIDPGESFPWRRLAASGHAIWSEAESGEAGDPWPRLRAAALRLGYRPDGAAEGEADLLRALQMRFAPDETGASASPRLLARIEDLAARFPLAEGDEATVSPA